MNQKTQTAMQEEWLDISYDQVNIEMLRSMIEEFIAREGFFLPEYFLEDKVDHVLEQLKKGKFKIVSDLSSGTRSIVFGTLGS